MQVNDKPKIIDESIFERWCKKHIEALLKPFAESLNIADLRQEAWLAAYEFLRYCQSNQAAINYDICKQRIIQAIKRYQQREYNAGITDSAETDIELQDDIEDFPAPTAQTHPIGKEYCQNCDRVTNFMLVNDIEDIFQCLECNAKYDTIAEFTESLINKNATQADQRTIGNKARRLYG